MAAFAEARGRIRRHRVASAGHGAAPPIKASSTVLASEADHRFHATCPASNRLRDRVALVPSDARPSSSWKSGGCGPPGVGAGVRVLRGSRPQRGHRAEDPVIAYNENPRSSKLSRAEGRAGCTSSAAPCRRAGSEGLRAQEPGARHLRRLRAAGRSRSMGKRLKLRGGLGVAGRFAGPRAQRSEPLRRAPFSAERTHSSTCRVASWLTSARSESVPSPRTEGPGGRGSRGHPRPHRPSRPRPSRSEYAAA